MRTEYRKNMKILSTVFKRFWKGNKILCYWAVVKYKKGADYMHYMNLVTWSAKRYILWWESLWRKLFFSISLNCWYFRCYNLLQNTLSNQSHHIVWVWYICLSKWNHIHINSVFFPGKLFAVYAVFHILLCESTSVVIERHFVTRSRSIAKKVNYI